MEGAAQGESSRKEKNGEEKEKQWVGGLSSQITLERAPCFLPYRLVSSWPPQLLSFL
jgi:hypothetical protein